MIFNGKKVFVSHPFYTVDRSIKERLFSWPWRPFAKTKQMPNPLQLKDGECLMSEIGIWCNQRTFNEIETSLNVQGEK